MSELEDILNYLETTSLEPHDDYVSEFSYKDQKTLWKYIKELQQENQELKKQLEEERKKVSEYSYKLSNFRCEETYETQQKEFIECLEKEIVDSRVGSGQQYYAQNHLRLYKEIIGKDINVSTKEAKNDG